jgi:hypothetical protein
LGAATALDLSGAVTLKVILRPADRRPEDPWHRDLAKVGTDFWRVVGTFQPGDPAQGVLFDPDDVTTSS